MTGRLTGRATSALLAWLAIGMLLPGRPQAGPGDASAQAERALANKRHRFCHDPAYPLTVQEAQWCFLAQSNDPVVKRSCPALAKVCAAGVRAKHDGWLRVPDFELPVLPGVARLFLWAGLAALVVLLIVLIAKLSLAGRRQPIRDGRSRASPGEQATLDPALAAAVETDVLRLLERARAAAAAGDYRLAVKEAYAALLRKLEGTGVIRVEPHRTNGDYLRDLGERQPGLRPRVGEVVAEVERVEFGGEPPGEARFRWVHDRVMGLVTERLTTLFPLLGLLGLLGAGSGCGREGWDDSPSGRSAVRAVLGENGLQASERVVPLARLNDDVHTLVLLPDAELKETDWPALQAWLEEKNRTLVVAGRPALSSDWLGVQFQPHNLNGTHPVVAVKFGTKAGPTPQITVPMGIDSISAADTERWRTLFTRGGRPYVLDRRSENRGRVVVFADDRLFCNAALLGGGNARALIDLLGARGKRVQFAGALSGIVSQTPVTAVARGRLAPALLQLGLVALLFFLYRGTHFGLPRSERASRRRAFVDHVRALGLVYARAGAGRVSLEHYGTWATERLSERLRLGGSQRLSSIAEAVSFRTGRPIGEVMRLLVEARSRDAGQAPGPGGSEGAKVEAEAMASLRALAALIAETGVEGTTSVQSRGAQAGPPPEPRRGGGGTLSGSREQ